MLSNGFFWTSVVSRSPEELLARIRTTSFLRWKKRSRLPHRDIPRLRGWRRFTEARSGLLDLPVGGSGEILGGVEMRWTSIR